MRILIAFPDVEVMTHYRNALTREGFVVVVADDGSNVVGSIMESTFDLVLLSDGLAPNGLLPVLKSLRARGYDAAIMVVQNGRSPEGKIQALEQGADDVVDSGILFAELIARIRVIARRQSSSMRKKRMVLIADPFRIDLLRREVRRGGKRIVVTRMEFDLLVKFLQNPGHVLSPQILVESVGHPLVGDYVGSVYVHINKLRSKIDIQGKRSFIRTERGCGYALDCER